MRPHTRQQSLRAGGWAKLLAIPAWLGIAASAWSADDLAAALEHDWHGPRSAAFAQAAAALDTAVAAYCSAPAGLAEASLDAARQRWLSALSSWERLAGVAVGPVLERRAQRAIDFTPTRPRLIEKAIRSAPQTPAAMELIGTPAKGLPALEWLLWTQPAAPTTPACAYAVQVAADLGREAGALAAARPQTVAEAALVAELVNQWVGGIERLRWHGMEMPVRVALTAAAPVAPDFPRRASGASAVAWAAQWDALRTLAEAGEYSLAGQLRRHGRADVADALVAEVAATDTAMQALSDADNPALLAAAQRLAALKQRVENAVAPALGVSIGFSDADGD